MFRRTKVCTGVMMAFAGSVGLGVAPAFAQQLDRVEITGSSIKRIEAETALPVTIITREEIARSGAVNMEQLVQNVSATATAGAQRGSDLAGQGTYGNSTVSLRGLEDKRTLVLVNGRRLAPFASDGAAVNINSISLSAIERVEVLRDGASAVYGSDAVAGVINFILRRDFNGFELTAEAGQPTQSGGGKTVRGNIVFGKGDLATDKYNFMIGFDAEKSTTLYASERSFSNSGNRAPYFQNAATPSGRIEGVWVPGKDADGNARQGAPNKPNFNPLGYSSSGYGNPKAPASCGDINMFPVNATGGVGGKFNNCNFDSAPFVGLFPRTTRTNLYGTFRVEVVPQATVYGEAMFARNQVTEAYQPAPARAGFFSTDNFFVGSGVDAALLIRPNNPYYTSVLVPYLQTHSFVDTYLSDPKDPKSPKISVTRPLSDMIGQTIAVTYRAFGAGLRTEQDTLYQSRIVLGVQGTVADWDYDAAVMFNKSRTEGALTEGYFSQVGLANVLNSSDWNPWGAGGAQTPEITSQLKATNYVGPTVSAASSQHSIDAKASTSLMEMPGGPLQMAVGGSARKELYQVKVPDILGTGDIAGLGGATSPEAASRTVYALFSEFNIPVLKELELNPSVRLDHYSDVGTSTNGKLSARWQPAKEFLLRSAVGTGFRAPTLTELHQPVTAGTTEQFIDPLNSGDGNVQPNNLQGGNANLKPEKSKQFSAGLVFSPTKTFTMSADYFVISIKNFIIKPSALGLVNAFDAGTFVFEPGEVTRAPDGTVDTVNQINRNSASALVRGADLGATWSDKFDTGRLTVDLNGTYMQTFNLRNITDQGSVGTVVQSDGTSPLDIASTGVVARWKHTLSANWNTGAWSTTLAQNYYAGYRDRNLIDDETPHYVPATATYDVQFAYTPNKYLKLTLGVKNFFDKDPPIFIGNGASFQYGYDPTMSDPRGRFMYAGMTVKF